MVERNSYKVAIINKYRSKSVYVIFIFYPDGHVLLVAACWYVINVPDQISQERLVLVPSLLVVAWIEGLFE